jgi:hypothetical protein
MARATRDPVEDPPGLIDKSEGGERWIDLETLDDRIAALLTAIEGEKIPERLLKLAGDLQNELVIRRQMKSPN